MRRPSLAEALEHEIHREGCDGAGGILERSSGTAAAVRVGQNACVPTYWVNEEAVRHAKQMIDARQYMLRSRWQDLQPRTREQNGVPEDALLGGVRRLASRPYGGRGRGDEGALRVCLWRPSSSAPDGADRVPLPCCGVAAQGDRACSTRVAAVPRPKDRPIMTWRELSRR
jgi:hypothetical protein